MAAVTVGLLFTMVLIKCSRIPFRNLYSSHSARAAFRLGEVIGNIFVLASGNLINVFFWH